MLKEKLKNSKSIEETNEILEIDNLPSYNNFISLSFRDRKRVYFNVKFGQLLSHNQLPYFSTSCDEFNRNRSDYLSCGQSQDRLLKDVDLLRFYKKWNPLHCEPLTMEQFNELKYDIELLKSKIPYVNGDKFYIKVSHDRELSN